MVNCTLLNNEKFIFYDVKNRGRPNGLGARQYVFKTRTKLRVLDIGKRNVATPCRQQFPSICFYECRDVFVFAFPTRFRYSARTHTKPVSDVIGNGFYLKTTGTKQRGGFNGIKVYTHDAFLNVSTLSLSPPFTKNFCSTKLLADRTRLHVLHTKSSRLEHTV